MENSSGHARPFLARYEEIFARLNEQDIEQFYAHYQLWLLHHRVPILEQQIDILREHMEENHQHMVAMRPSAIAMAVLARLQSKGVSDVEILDQMLERGEDWLDRMMQRLDYCEQVEDFIRGDYTQWCINSLDGAYDWIDTVRNSPPEETDKRPTVEMPGEAEEAQATEELLLQKLSTDDEETMRGVTLKLPVTKREVPEPAMLAETEFSLPEEFATSAEEAEAEEIEAGSEEAVALIETALVGGEALETLEEAMPLAAIGEQEHPEAASEEVASWYDQEADETFTFAEPRPMNDWIEVLQADAEIRGDTETAEVSLASANEIILPETPPSSSAEESATALQVTTEEGLSASELEPGVALEEADALETLQPALESSAESSEPAVEEASLEALPSDSESEIAVESPEMLVEESSGQEAEGATGDQETDGELAKDIDTLTSSELADELESLVQETAAISEELVEASEAISTDEEANPAHQLVEEIEVLVRRAEVLGETDETEEALPGETATDTSAEALPPLAELTAASPVQEHAEAAISSPLLEEPVANRPLEAEILSSATEASGGAQPAMTTTSSQEHEYEDAAVINFILEPAEGELAWYEYLELEKLNQASQHEMKASAELEEHQAESSAEAQPEPSMLQPAAELVSAQVAHPIGEHSPTLQTKIDEPEAPGSEAELDQTFALKEVQRSLREQASLESAGLAKQTSKPPQSINAEDISPERSEQNISATEQEISAPSALPESQETLAEVEISVESEQAAQSPGEQETPGADVKTEAEAPPPVLPMAAEEVQKQPEPGTQGEAVTQEKPRKRSFWQWLFRRKPRDSA